MDEFDPRPNTEAPTAGLSLSDAEQHRFLAILSGPLYQISRVCKPVLQRLDEALSSGGASYDELVSIEHVLPQTVDDGSEWATLFPDEQERSEWTHRLANLAFLTHRINTRASNWEFERKKKEYFASSDGSSPFVITQGVLQAEKWTPEHLYSRQRQLLEKLSEVWRLEAVDVEEELIDTGPQLRRALGSLQTAQSSRRSGKKLWRHLVTATQTRPAVAATATHHRAGQSPARPSQRRVVETFAMRPLVLLTFFAELGKLG
jgi:hypothetical protein